MERQAVNSDAIKSIGYNEIEEVLEIEFTNGGIYEYFPVPLVIYETFMDSQSKGLFYNFYIKGVYS